jgi:hypothetical protein
MVKTRSQVHDKKQELEETVLLGTLEEEQSKIEIIYKEPPTELKLQVGEQLLNHKKTWQELSASMKRQGYHHSKPALYRWKEHYAAGTRPRHAGGQTNLTSPQRKLVDDQAATAVVTRSAKSVKAFKRLVALAYLNSRKERGVSSLGIPKKKQRNLQRFVRTLIRMVKPQVTTLPRWLACNCVRNAISLFCVLVAVMFLLKWILPGNTWNYDITTYCFGYVSHSSNKQAAVPRGLQMYREIELVGTKTKSLPHSVKLASLQGASGAAGELVFLYKVKMDWFWKDIKTVWDSLQKGAQASATSDVVQRARRVIMRKMEALVKMFKSLVSDTLAIPVPELLIEQTLVLFKLPVPGLGRFCSPNEYSHYWFVTHSGNAAAYEHVLFDVHFPFIVNARDTALSPYARYVCAVVCARGRGFGGRGLCMHPARRCHAPTYMCRVVR